MRLLRAFLDTALKDHAPASFTKITTDVTIQAVAQSTPAAVNTTQVAKPAADSFFNVAAIKEDRRAALGELREAAERVRGLEAQAASPLFGDWQPPEGAREAGEALIDKVVSFARLKGLGEGAEGEFVKLSAAVGGGASAFNALGDEKVSRAAGEAASAIRCVVEKAWATVRPVVAIASRALAKAKPAPELVGLGDEDFRRASTSLGGRFTSSTLWGTWSTARLGRGA